jgi:hypothetical protein
MSGESGDAKLIYNKLVNDEIVEVSIDTFITVADIYGQEFYLSYQSGIAVQCAFKVSSYDFEETKHIEADTGKPLYAIRLLYDGAKYDIVRHQAIKNTETTLLICS